MISPVLARASLRYLARHPWLLVLSVVGVALGVAVVVAIDLANASATRGFARSADTVAGRATHALVGGGGTVSDTLYRHLRLGGIRETAPVVDGVATARGRVVTVLGLDPLADGAFRDVAGEAGGLDLGLFLATPGTAFVSPGGAAALGVVPGDTLGLDIDGRRTVLRVAALLQSGTADDEARQAAALDGLVVMDVATAQRVLGLAGRLSRVDLLVPAGPGADARLAEVRARLPAGVRIERAAARGEALETMTRAFRFNLSALSFLALIVGMFLVYNVTTFAVVQRRFLLGRLRALGVSRREVLGLVMGEALLLGLVGTAFGLALGVVMGRGLVGLVAQTITDLYFVLDVRGVALPLGALVKGGLLGVATTLAAAFFPAREAASADVTAVLRRSEPEAALRDSRGRIAALGGVLLALGGGVLALPRVPLAVAYAALLAVVLGASLLVPSVLAAAGHAARRPLGWMFGATGRMAAGALGAHLRRLSVAVAALSVALAATIGVGVMIASFRQTVVVWLDGVLTADVFVQPPTLTARRGDSSLDPALVAALVRLPGVADAYTVRRTTTQSQVGATDLLAISGGAAQEASFRLKDTAPGGADAAWAAMRAGTAVMVSEPFAYRHRLAPGDTVRLETDRGPRAFPIAAVTFDYGSDLGLVMLMRPAYERLYDDRGTSGLALVAAPGASPEQIAEAVRRASAGRQAVVVRSNRALRQYSLDVFDRTFAITAVLRLLALVVAFVGVVSALMALQLERAREYATLRALGLSPTALVGLVSVETGLVGLVAGLLSLPLGLALAAALVFVVNRQSFGWTLQATVPPSVLATSVGLALVAALLAGLYPAWKIARTSPADALRTE